MPAYNLSELTSARYGKTNVRVFRVVREGKCHHIVEYNVEALLEGYIATSQKHHVLYVYSLITHGPTLTLRAPLPPTFPLSITSIPPLTFHSAPRPSQISPHILNPEKFALHLGTFLVSKYAHIHKAFVSVEQLRWTRVQVPTSTEGAEAKAEAHSHAFYRDGDDKRTVKVEVDGTAGKDKLVGKVTAGITGLLVLKTTGSAFHDFLTDEYTTLVPVPDRIFSTSIDLSYTFTPIPLPSPQDAKKLDFVVPIQDGGSVWDEEVPGRARVATLETFAVDESASVQATLYKMAQRIIAENSGIKDVSYSLPNKHYVPVDMKYIGVDNTTPAAAEVFVPIAHPSGLISATISRK